MATTDDWSPTWAPQSEDNLAPTYIAICSILMAAATVTVALRLVAQRMVTRKLLADDWFIIAGWLLTLGNFIATVICFTNGGGRHLSDVIANDPDPLQTMLTFWKAGYMTINLWVWSSFAIKMALFFFLRRIFHQSPLAMIALNATLVFIIIAFGYAFFSYIFSCLPVDLFWLQAYADVGLVPPTSGSCPAFLERGIAAAALTIATDVFLFSIPVVGVWNLKMTRERKFGLIGVFFLGSFAVIVSIVRLPYIFTESFTKDPPYAEANALFFSIIETTVGIICTCLPCLAPLYRHYKPQKGSSYYPKGSTYGSSANSKSRRTNDTWNSTASTKRSLVAPEDPYNLDDLKPERTVHQTV